MSKIRLIDLPVSPAVGTDFVLAGNSTEVFISSVSSISLSQNTITSFVGSVPRSLSSRFSDVVNVLDFGVVGDGITVNINNIQNAINAAVNPTVIFPQGTYIIPGQIVLPSRVKVQGFNATLKQTSSSTTTFSVTGARNVIIDGLTFNGCGSTDTAVVDVIPGNANAKAVGIRFSEKTSNVTIQNCTFNNFKNAGVLFTGGGSAIEINNNVFSGTSSVNAVKTNYQYGVGIHSNITTEAEDEVDLFVKDITITNNIFNGTNQGIVISTPCYFGNISNNIIKNVGYTGISLIAANHNKVSNNTVLSSVEAIHCFHPSGSSIDVVPSNLGIEQNIISDCNKGITINVDTSTFNTHYSVSSRIHKNTIINSYNLITPGDALGVELFNCRDIDVNGNTFNGIDGNGIEATNCTGTFNNNTFTSVAGSIGFLRTIPNGYCTINNTFVTNCSGVGDSYITLYKPSILQQRQQYRYYLKNSFIKSNINNNIYISSTSGMTTLSDDPSASNQVFDGGVTWDHFSSVNAEYYMINNIIVSNNKHTPTYSLSTDNNLNLTWYDNVLPTTIANTSIPLSAAVLANVRIDRNNIYGGLIPTV